MYTLTIVIGARRYSRFGRTVSELSAIARPIVASTPNSVARIESVRAPYAPPLWQAINKSQEATQ
jgi:hypothetical protein